MNRRSTLLAAVLALATLSSAGVAYALFGASVTPSGKVVTESRAVGAFTGISVTVPGTVVVRQGEAAPVAIDADDNLMPIIETVVERGVLKIRFKDNASTTGRATVRVLVSAPAIDSLTVGGSGEILSEAIKAGALDISVAGSGDVKIAKLEAGTLKTSVAGSGDVRVAGRADDLSVSIAGSGDVEAPRLQTRRAKVSIAGSGDVALWATESLDVSSVGSGDVAYYGDPALKKSFIGSGSVKRLGAAP
jgi:hypothetical protein